MAATYPQCHGSYDGYCPICGQPGCEGECAADGYGPPPETAWDSLSPHLNVHVGQELRFENDRRFTSPQCLPT